MLREVRSRPKIMLGVESTRALGSPMKLIATSGVTSSFSSRDVPIGIWATGLSPQTRKHAAHVGERGLHPGERAVFLDLVFERHGARVFHFLEFLEDSDDRQNAL